jgi:hypothetical protein
MKRNRKGSRKQQQIIQVWTHEQARRVMPYLTSIVRSLREHRLEAVHHHRRSEKLVKKHGRPNRSAIIAHEEAIRQHRDAEDRFNEALNELHTLDIYCLDPIQGQALIPFGVADELAWFVFDLFEKDTPRFWRFHSDPIEARRPLAELSPSSLNK